jgi:thiol-disulfide isomerase/thioredoxin
LESDLRAPIVPILLIITLIAGCDKQSPPAPQPKAADAAPATPEVVGVTDMSNRGLAMPAASFFAPDGRAVTLASFKGKPVLVNLWATWCGPCVAELPTLDALAGRAAGRLEVIVANQDNRETRPRVDSFWATKAFAHLQPYLDPDYHLDTAFGTGQLPTTVLYDKDGKEVWRVVGAMDWDGPRANTLLAEVLG